jgi:Cu/Ag efflux pump CusA
VVIVGGTMSAALLTLVVLPALYRMWNGRKRGAWRAG